MQQGRATAGERDLQPVPEGGDHGGFIAGQLSQNCSLKWHSENAPKEVLVLKDHKQR